ncbi:MAG: glycosyltransferase family 25 protein, partial [Acidobacteriota bacterium]
MNVDEFFPHQVCINLDTRRDRWERMTARFAEHGISRVIRFPAINGNHLDVPSFWRYSPGAYGCLRSHLAVVEQARDYGRPSVLIFEDDVVLAPDFTAKFADYVEQLPDDWDMVFFGALHGQPLTKATDNLLRINHSLSTFAYALKDTVYDSFIHLNRQALTVLDENTRALQKRFNSYCFTPNLAWVEEDYSDVRGEMVNLWWLKESLVLYGPEIDDILKKSVAV